MTVLGRRVGALVVAVASLTAGTVVAQERGTKVGPEFGLNFAKFSGTAVEDAETRTGIALGGFLSFLINRNFAIEPHLLYSQQGAKWEVDDATGTFKLDYIQVPVLLKVLFGATSTRPFITAGPSIGFKAGCKFKAEDDSVSLSVDCDAADVPIKSTDVSMLFGGGVEFGAWVFALRYGLGLSNVIDVSPTPEVKNRLLSLTGAYSFRLR